MTSLQVLQEVQQMLMTNKPREEICTLIENFTIQQANLSNVHAESLPTNADTVPIMEDTNKDFISTLVTVLPVNDQVDRCEKSITKEEIKQEEHYEFNKREQAQASDKGKHTVMHTTGKFITTPNTIVASPVWARRDDEGNPLSSTEQIETFVEADISTKSEKTDSAYLHANVDNLARRSSLCSNISLHSRSERHELSMYVNSTFSREVDRSAHSLMERHLPHSLSEISLNHRSSSTPTSSSSTTTTTITTTTSTHSSSPASTCGAEHVAHSCEIMPTCITQTKNNYTHNVRMNRSIKHKGANATRMEQTKESKKLISPLHLPSSEVTVHNTVKQDNSNVNNSNLNINEQQEQEQQQRRLCHSDSSLMRMSKVQRGVANAPREFTGTSKRYIPTSTSYSPETFPTASASTSTSSPTRLVMHDAVMLQAPSLTTKTAADNYYSNVDENEKPLSLKYTIFERHTSSNEDVQPALHSTVCECAINDEDNDDNDYNNNNHNHYPCKEDDMLFEQIAQMSGHSTKWCAQPTLHSAALSHYSRPLSKYNSETCLNDNNNNNNNNDDDVSFVTSTFDSRRSSIFSVNTPLYHKKVHMDQNKNKLIVEQEECPVTETNKKDIDHSYDQEISHITAQPTQSELTLESVHGDASAECGHSILALSSLESEMSTETSSLSYTSVPHNPDKAISTEEEEEEEEKNENSIDVTRQQENYYVFGQEKQDISKKLLKEMNDEVNHIKSQTEENVYQVNVSAPSCKVKVQKGRKTKKGKQLRNGNRFMPPFVLDSRVNRNNVISETREQHLVNNEQKMKSVAISAHNGRESADNESATHHTIRPNEEHQINVQQQPSTTENQNTRWQYQHDCTSVNDGNTINVNDNQTSSYHNNGIGITGFQPIIRFARLFVRRTDPFLPTSQVKKTLINLHIPFMSEIDITCATGVVTRSVHLERGTPSSINVFTLAEKYGGATMLFVNTCMNVLLRYSFSVAFTFDCHKLLLFLKKLSTYLVESNPFHNYLHAVDVLLAAHEWLCDSAAVIYCSDEELFSFLFASLICNVAHCGIDESTMEALNHPYTLIARGSLPPQQGAILSLVGALLDEDEMRFLPTTSVS